MDGGFTAKCTIEVNYHCETPEMVDLGLSVKWASCNVGASYPWEYGDYFAWGETESKEDYSWSTYKWCMNGSSSQFTKYCLNPSCGYNGFFDNKYTLDPKDDAAAVNLGGSWRMPTIAEQRELINDCTWEWTTLNGVYGRKVTSNKSGYTDKWIFLPAAGYRFGTSLRDAGNFGLYWSSSLDTDYPGGHQSIACDMCFDPGSVGYNFFGMRDDGCSVRPVCD